MKLVLEKLYYNTEFTLEHFHFEGCCIVNKNIIESMYGPIFYNNSLIASIIQSNDFVRFYEKGLEQSVLQFIDQLKQELENKGYVVTL